MIRRALLTLGFVVVAAVPAMAQVLGLPVVNNGAPTGLTVGADVGLPNADYGSGTAIGARAALGLGFFGVSAAVSHYTPKGGDGVWSQGASATLRLLGGPLVPFRITLQGGFGTWKTTVVTPGGIGSNRVTHIPISLGLSGTIPNPAFAIKPWIAPRVDVMRVGGGGDARFGISGGVDVALLSGIAIRAAYDRRSEEQGVNPGIFSLGLGFAP
ncbi:MAG: hypothetical protein ACRELE_06995 [Gemmatimonadales bacterium]